MELSNQLLGIHEKDTKLNSFEWRGRNPEAKHVELPEKLPLETNCRYSATKLIADAGCEGCTAAHRGICLIHNDAAEHRQVKRDIPDKKANELMVDLVIQILQGRCFNDLKGYLLSKYTRDFLNEKLIGQQQWLQVPGYLGLIMIDTTWFGSCGGAAKRCNGHPFSPSYVLHTDACASCENNKEKVCSKIGSRIFVPGDKVTSDVVICHINEMVSRNLISTMDGSECKKIAKNNPLHGLAIAVRLARNPVQSDETDLIQNLHNLGTKIEDTYISIFENEPHEQQEQKTMLYGPEMLVKINPRPNFENINYIETLDKCAGVDGYLQKK